MKRGALNSDTIRFKAGYKYQLAETFETLVRVVPAHELSTHFIDLLPTDGSFSKLVVRKDYAWDGPSGPTVDTKNFMRASLVHDALYQLMRRNMLSTDFRQTADEELRRFCRVDGMSRFRSWIVFRAVRRFASSAASFDSAKQVLTAP